ncbi:very-long-chain (3R)-3-hydroxyacyl-CoA dehydratase 4 isoform X1 [Arapaima gigas]
MMPKNKGRRESVFSRPLHGANSTPSIAETYLWASSDPPFSAIPQYRGPVQAPSSIARVLCPSPGSLLERQRPSRRIRSSILQGCTDTFHHGRSLRHHAPVPRFLPLHRKPLRSVAADLQRDMRSTIGLAYLFLYNLLQFCGHTWIFANMTARFLSFGGDAVDDTFYSVGVAMSLCQLLSALELFHIADGLEKGPLLPRFVQVVERIFLLFAVIIGQEEVQSKPIVCALFYLWNILGLLRYPHQLACLFSAPSLSMLWVHYTLWVPLYPLSVLAEVMTVFQALPYFGSQSTGSTQPPSTSVHLSYVLKGYLPLLAAAACVAEWQLLKDRRHQLETWTKKLKRK